jgi:hypothetical protein
MRGGKTLADGLLLRDGEGVLWLTVHRELRRISDRSVVETLFSEEKHVADGIDLSDVSRGSDICSGSCLVRGDGSVGIFFVTGYPDTRRHRIRNFEAFQAYGFNLGAVRNVPVLVLEQIPLGTEIDAPDTPS